MIAQAAWFNRRKYTGWGLSPKTWQGFAYILAIAGVAALIQILPLAETSKMVLTVAGVAFVLIDILQAMASLKLDEREQKIEAISERNASWTMVAATVVAIFYTVTVGQKLTGLEFMPVLIFPILAGTAVKGISNFMLEKRGI